MKPEQMLKLKMLADQVAMAMQKCYDYSQHETPNAAVGMMMMEIHKQLIHVIEQG